MNKLGAFVASMGWGFLVFIAYGAGWVSGFWALVIWIIVGAIIMANAEEQDKKKIEEANQKKCVMCAEVIQKDAKKCKHCGEMQA